jgi:hypothetical protein
MQLNRRTLHPRTIGQRLALRTQRSYLPQTSAGRVVSQDGRWGFDATILNIRELSGSLNRPHQASSDTLFGGTCQHRQQWTEASRHTQHRELALLTEGGNAG